MYIAFCLHLALLFTGHQRPSLKLLFKYVKIPIAPIWFDFGIELLDEKYEKNLVIYKKDHGVDSEEGCSKMLQLWLDSDTNACWNQLICVSKTLKKTALANDIRKMLSDGM